MGQELRKIAFGEAVDLVRPDLGPHVAPAQVDVRVVPLLFGQLADTVREVERRSEVLEAELLLEMVLVHGLPTATERRLQVGQFPTGERRDPASAWHACFPREIARHDSKPPGPRC
jgi:hypothetical protein